MQLKHVEKMSHTGQTAMPPLSSLAKYKTLGEDTKVFNDCNYTEQLVSGIQSVLSSRHLKIPLRSQIYNRSLQIFLFSVQKHKLYGRMPPTPF